MNVRIYPSIAHNKAITLPSSKSELHRVLLIIAFSSLKGEVYNCTVNDDILSTINFLEGIGSKIEIRGNTIYLDNTNLLKKVKNEYFVNESGTTLRLMIPFLARLNREIVIYTKGNLINRPLNVYQDFMNIRKENLLIDKANHKIEIRRHKFDEEFIIRGNVSSQFISALLLYQSLMQRKGSVVVLKPLASKPYIDLTIGLLEKFGYKIEINEESNIITYSVASCPNTIDLLNYTVESDYSSAAFFMGLGTINNDLTLTNLNKDSFQADKKMVSILKEMNCDIKYLGNLIEVKKSKLNASTIDLFSCPDIGPILFAISSTINEKTTFINTKRLEEKESNRLISMKNNLDKLGVDFKIFDNSVEIIGNKELKNGDVFDSFNDHRIAMSMAILATILKTPSLIKNAECVSKSYPDFFKDLEKLGVEVDYE